MNEEKKMERPLTVALIQAEGYGSPACFDKKANLEANLDLMDKACQSKEVDFVLFSELFTTPYFCALQEDRFFDLAETIPGETTEVLSERARRHGCYVLAPIFEKVIPGEYYDCMAVIDPKGKLVPGRLPGGVEMKVCRKAHIPSVYTKTTRTNEKHYFRQAQGLPIFKTEKVTFGGLVCYDRSFPESWRTLALRGAEVVFVPVVSYGFRHDMFLTELRTRATENGLFAVACNRGGKEAVDFEVTLFGCSAVIDPWGEILAQGPAMEGPAIVTCTFDLADVEKTRRALPLLRDRRPEIYTNEAEEV